MPIFLKLFPKFLEQRMLLNSFLEARVTPKPKPGKNITKRKSICLYHWWTEMQTSSTKYWQTESNNTWEGSHTMIRWDLSQGYKDFSISANQSVWYTTLTNWRVKNHMIVSKDAEHAFDNVQHPCMIKNLQKREPTST